MESIFPASLSTTAQIRPSKSERVTKRISNTPSEQSYSNHASVPSLPAFKQPELRASEKSPRSLRLCGKPSNTAAVAERLVALLRVAARGPLAELEIPHCHAIVSLSLVRY